MSNFVFKLHLLGSSTVFTHWGTHTHTHMHFLQVCAATPNLDFAVKVKRASLAGDTYLQGILGVIQAIDSDAVL